MRTAPERCGVVVVGAGIVGLSVARSLRLRHQNIDVAVIEASEKLASHQTSHNSGVVHAGIYYKPGSLKARLCVAGLRDLPQFCDAHSIPLRRLGKVIVARDRSELGTLDAIEERGRANGVPELRRIDAEELRSLEPAVVGVEALHSPQTAVVDYGAVARAYATDLTSAGGSVILACRVEAVDDRGGEVVVRHAAGETVADYAIVCAGAWAEDLQPASVVGPRLVNFRGTYRQLKPGRTALVNGLIYPVPDPALPFLGMHFTHTVDDRVLLGPTALMVGAPDAYRLTRVSASHLRRTLGWPGSWRMARRWWRTGIHELSLATSSRAFLAEARKFVPALELDDIIPAQAGVRAQPVARDGALIDDFLLRAEGRVVHVQCAPSPAATSSLPLGNLIVESAEEALGLGGRMPLDHGTTTT